MTFKTIARQISNISDADADMEMLKSSVDMLVDDVDVIKMAQYFIYNHTKK
jgi:hypothetical protein